jgi:lysozyme
MTAIDLIKSFEGCRLAAYRDDGGVWTIGWGHTGPDVREWLVWTQAQADAALERDTARAAAVVSAIGPLPPDATAALTSLAYNIGVEAFEHSTLRRMVADGGVTGEAALQFAEWVLVGGQVNRGLVRRRAREMVVFLGHG